MYKTWTDSVRTFDAMGFVNYPPPLPVPYLLYIHYSDMEDPRKRAIFGIRISDLKGNPYDELIGVGGRHGVCYNCIEAGPFIRGNDDSTKRNDIKE